MFVIITCFCQYLKDKNLQIFENPDIYNVVSEYQNNTLKVDFVELITEYNIEFNLVNISSENKSANELDLKAQIYIFTEKIAKILNQSDDDSLKESVSQFVKYVVSFKDVFYLQKDSIENLLPSIFIYSVIDIARKTIVADQDITTNDIKDKLEKIFKLSNNSINQSLKDFNRNDIVKMIKMLKETNIPVEFQEQYKKDDIYSQFIYKNESSKIFKFAKATNSLVEKMKNDANYSLIGLYDLSLVKLIILLEMVGDLDDDFLHLFRLLNLLIKTNSSVFAKDKQIKVASKIKFKMMEFIIHIHEADSDSLKNEFKNIIKDAIPSKSKLRNILSQLTYNQDHVEYKKFILLPYLLLDTSLEQLLGKTSLRVFLEDLLETDHIFPQAPKDNINIEDYSFEDELDFEHYVHSVGNLTLVTKKLNKELSNLKPADRISIYEKQEHHYFKQLAQTLRDFNIDKDPSKYKECIKHRREKMFDIYISSYNQILTIS